MDTQEDGDAVVAVGNVGGHTLLQEKTHEEEQDSVMRYVLTLFCTFKTLF